MEWTDAQRQAIEARGSNLLVSAAAGSGKTAVLAERIVAIVKDGAKIDDLLIMTFTKAAAAEMRARIMETLHDAAEDGNRRLSEQALRVERADISTLHGFCMKICRDHFQVAGLDPTFRVADSAEVDVLRDQALTAALTACYEEPSEAFAMADACMTQPMLIESVQSLHRFLMARPDPWTWLGEAVDAHDLKEETLSASPWMAALLSRVELDARLAVDAYRRLVSFAVEVDLFIDFARNEATKAEAFLHDAQAGYDAICAHEATVFARRPSKRKDMDEEAVKRFAQLRDDAKAALKDAESAVSFLRQPDLLVKDEADIRLVLQGIAEAASVFDNHFRAMKQEKNLLDFNDLEHFALAALRDPSVSRAVRARYRYVFIDEYQDSSLLQEAVLSRIVRRDNLFMVGDVKQSIYRFRLADPSLFLDKLHTFQSTPNTLNRRIALNANFRSHPVLLGAINAVFERVFSGGVMELSYDEDERLSRGADSAWEGAPAELHLMTDELPASDEEEDAATADELSQEAKAAIRQEAEWIADRITALLDAPEGGYHLRDIAILMRAVRGKASQMVEVLRSRGIPAWSDMGEDALARTEIEAMVSLLQVIDNLRQDIPLLAALRGPALGLTDDSLAAIRAAQPEGAFAEAVLAYAERDGALAAALQAFIERVRGWGLDAQVLPLDSLVRLIYQETGHYAESGALPDGEVRQANLRALAEHAGAYQRAQAGGLGGFLRYLSRVREHDGIAAQELGERDNVVRILSVHKSKGLQYPVVFVAGLGSRFGNQDAKKTLQTHSALGIGIAHVDPILRTKRTSLSRAAILEKRRQEALAEEARVLYVAMTRAKWRLILVGTPRAGEVERWTSGHTTTPAMARSMLDWIVPIALNHQHWQIAYHRKNVQPTVYSASRAIHGVIGRVRALSAPDAHSNVAMALSWEADFANQQPLKQSVSSVVQTEAKEGEREEERLNLSALSRRPLFLEARGLTATERGDAVHAFLRSIPLDTKDLEEARRSMQERGILSAEQAKTLPMAKLRHMLSGPLWQRMQSAKILHREWPFNLRQEINGRRTLLQGIIDCCFMENGAWVLVDYKSDRADDVEALLNRYRPQLSLYSEALERITGIPVRERILYLIDKENDYAI